MNPLFKKTGDPQPAVQYREEQIILKRPYEELTGQPILIAAPPIIVFPDGKEYAVVSTKLETNGLITVQLRAL